jgi:hypothetical protein
MKTHGMTAEVFLAAFRTLPKTEQNIFLTNVLKDRQLREDVIDIAIAEGRIKEKGRSFNSFLKEQGA